MYPSSSLIYAVHIDDDTKTFLIWTYENIFIVVCIIIDSVSYLDCLQGRTAYNMSFQPR